MCYGIQQERKMTPLRKLVTQLREIEERQLVFENNSSYPGLTITQYAVKQSCTFGSAPNRFLLTWVTVSFWNYNSEPLCGLHYKTDAVSLRRSWNSKARQQQQP